MKGSLTSEWSFKHSNSWKSCWTEDSYKCSERLFNWMTIFIGMEIMLLLIIPVNFWKCSQDSTKMCDTEDVWKALFMGIPIVLCYGWSMRLHHLYTGNEKYKYNNNDFRYKMIISHALLVLSQVVGLILCATIHFGIEKSIEWSLGFHISTFFLSMQYFFVFWRYAQHDKNWEASEGDRNAKIDAKFDKKKQEIMAKYEQKKAQREVDEQGLGDV